MTPDSNSVTIKNKFQWNDIRQLTNSFRISKILHKMPTLRIITGKHKSLRITAPESLPVRPTTDMAKTGLFNILENYFYFENIRVLDLFCGTGNISYEFSSRGCPEIDSVDKNIKCIRFIKETMVRYSILGITAFHKDSFDFLENSSGKYDIIFADPPFELKVASQLTPLLFSRQKLKKDGWFILEHSSRDDYSTLPHFTEIRKYGSAAFSIFRESSGLI